MSPPVIDLTKGPICVSGFGLGGSKHLDAAEFSFHFTDPNGDDIGIIRLSLQSFEELAARAAELMSGHFQMTNGGAK